MPGHPKLSRLRREQKWKVCEAVISSTGQTCRRQVTDGISSMCRRHLRLRGQHGSVRALRHVQYEDYHLFVKLARKRLRRSPPSTPVLDAITSLLTPPQPYRTAQPGWRARSLLVRELDRIAHDPRAKKTWTAHERHDYSPTGILTVLVACQTYLEERQNFPGDSESIELAFSILRLWRRPRGRTRTGKTIKSQALSPTVLRLFAKRIRERTEMMTFVLLASREILREQADLQAQKNLNLKAQAAARAAMPRPAPKPFIPTDPGPRPMLRTIEDAERVRAWFAADAKWKAYQKEKGM